MSEQGLSASRRCVKCGTTKPSSQFVEHETPGTKDKCLQCLPQNANGFSECVKCHVRKRGNDFHHRKSGRRSRLCHECYPKNLLGKKCTDCGKYQVLDMFAVIQQPAGGKKRRSVCTDCFKPKVRSRICYRCRERVSVDAFACSTWVQKKDGRIAFRRDNFCLDCANQEKPVTQRECCSCNTTKPIDQFRKILWGRRSRRCKACPVPTNHGKGGQLLRKLPEPCLQCEEEMWTYHPPSRTAEAKYCSRKCAELGRRFTTRQCDQCREELPRSEFGDRPCSKAQSLWRCKQCLQDIREGRVIARPGSCTAISILRQLRNRSAREKVKLKLSYREVRELLAGTCCFCQGTVDTLAAVDLARTIEPKNLRGLCLQCRHFIGARSVADMLAFARRAAEANGWMRPSYNVAPKPKRKLALELTPPKGMKRSDLVPPEVHGMPVVGEPWDARVARHQKIRGPLGSKRKPDEEHYG